jgi:hypothetical protein
MSKQTNWETVFWTNIAAAVVNIGFSIFLPRNLLTLINVGCALAALGGAIASNENVKAKRNKP